MGLFDMFGSTPEKKAQKLKAKVTQKYGDPLTRQKAIEQTAELKSTDGWAVLLHRFALTVEPQTTDAMEKEAVFNHLVAAGPAAIAPIQSFIESSEQATSWGLKLLGELQSAEEVQQYVCRLLEKYADQYLRGSEKKVVLLQYLEGKSAPGTGAATLPYLADMGDDIRIAALRTLASIRYQPATGAIVDLLADSETPRRVKTCALQALVDGAFDLTGHRDRLTPLLGADHVLETSGLLRKKA